MLNPYQAPEAERVSTEPDIDVSSDWSVEVAAGTAFTLAGRHTGLLGGMAAAMAATSAIATLLSAVSSDPRFITEGLFGAAVLLGVAAASMVLAVIQLAVTVVIDRKLLDLVRGETRPWPSIGGMALMVTLLFVGNLVVGFAGMLGMLFFIAPGLIVFACTYVWRYALIDGDQPIEAFKTSWLCTRHSWVRLLAWMLLFYGVGAVGGFLAELADDVLVKVVIGALFTFVSVFVLWPADVAIYVQMRHALDAVRGSSERDVAAG
jgi:hypothetical protein